MKTKSIGLIVLILLILSPLLVWSIVYSNRKHQPQKSDKDLIALGQDQSIYSNQDSEIFDGEELFMESKLYTFTMNDIDGNPVSLAQYQGKVVLVVNVASKCGFTKQYAGLQALYEKYQEQGFVILGFPANNFMGQEPGTDAEIKAFCTTNFNVTFPMFSKISVKGKDIHPLYQYLTNPEESGKFAHKVTWNFNKFLIDKKGQTINYFGSRVDPLGPDMMDAVEKALRDNLL